MAILALLPGKQASETPKYLKLFKTPSSHPKAYSVAGYSLKHKYYGYFYESTGKNSPGFAGINEIMGVQHKLMLDFVAGYGFTGIAVALMGRNHPVGIIMASILFGALFQGGAELSFDMPTISKEMVFVIQGLIILFSGALAYMSKPWIEKLFSFFYKDISKKDT